MKCVYFLTATLQETCKHCRRLQQLGVNARSLHVISNNEAGLRHKRLHAGNYLERLDIIRCGILGALTGFTSGSLLALIMLAAGVFAFPLPDYAYYIVVAVFTLFGAWVGGLTGIAYENKKLARFHDDIAADKYLILAYLRPSQQELLIQITCGHTAIEPVAVDEQFFNPFSRVRGIHLQPPKNVHERAAGRH